MGADLLRVVVSSNSNTTRAATGGGSRERERDRTLSPPIVSLYEESHPEKLDLECLMGQLDYEKVFVTLISPTPFIPRVATLLCLLQNRWEDGGKVYWA